MNISPVNMQARAKVDMRPGDTVRVSQKIQEKGKTRLQVFEGMILARKHGTEDGATFTVRRTTGGYGVEKIFPLYSPMIDKIEVTKRSNVRRSKLYFIRRKALKEISKRLKMMFVDFKEEPADVAEIVADTVEVSEAEDVVSAESDVSEAGAPAEETVAEETPTEEAKSEVK